MWHPSSRNGLHSLVLVADVLMSWPADAVYLDDSGLPAGAPAAYQLNQTLG